MTSAVVHLADCLDVLRAMPAESVDAVVCDPPYGLGFMGREWDALPPGREWAEAVLRVVKPGGHLVAFGGQRTIHRLTCALEDAGWEIRDQIGWVYWSGFPKSLDVSKAIDAAAGAEREVVGPYKFAARTPCSGGQYHASHNVMSGATRHPTHETAPATFAARQWSGWGTALKPAIEPAVLARKPFPGTVAANVQRYGTGALNIDGCRYADGDPAWPGPNDARTHAAKCASVVGLDSNRNGNAYGEWGGAREDSFSPLGRWPANLYACPKASRRERERGCESLPARSGAEAVDREEGSAGAASPRAGAGRTAAAVRNHHPTVKPVALMRWLCRLVTPPGGLVLDPFTGSGTTGVAAVLEGFDFIGCEREPDFHAIAEARIGCALRGEWEDRPRKARKPRAPKPEGAEVLPLFPERHAKALGLVAMGGRP